MKVIIDIDEQAYRDGHLCNFFGCYSTKLDEIIYNGISLEDELEKIYGEVKAVELTTPIISKGYDCYGIKDKTAEEMRTEILDIIYNHIKENSK